MPITSCASADSADLARAMKRKKPKVGKAKVAKPKVAMPKPAEREAVVAERVEAPVPYLLLRMSGVIDESSMPGLFEQAGANVLAAKAKRVLVDLRDCTVQLSISDMHGLVKMIAGAFVGSVERLSLLLQARDLLPEKFVEPALNSRGLLTLATDDYDEAVYWIASKLPPRR